MLHHLHNSLANRKAADRKRMLWRFMVISFLFVPILFPVKPAKAAWCWCTDYVKNRYQLVGAIGGDAKDMGPYLTARGFVQIGKPQVRAVVIMKPAFGVDPRGHVGVITRVEDLGTSWRITVRGANQAGTKFYEYGCDNVYNTVYKSYSKSWGSYYITYWSRNLALGRGPWAASQESTSHIPAFGIDGDRVTRWSSQISGSLPPQWYTVDLQATRTFDRVIIRWENAYAAKFFVGYSNDGKTFYGFWWTNTSPGTKVYLFSGGRTARWVGVYMTQRAPCCGNYSFWELEVFANAQGYTGY